MPGRETLWMLLCGFLVHLHLVAQCWTLSTGPYSRIFTNTSSIILWDYWASGVALITYFTVRIHGWLQVAQIVVASLLPLMTSRPEKTWQRGRIIQSCLHLLVMKMMLEYEVICPTNLTQFSLTAAVQSCDMAAVRCCHLEAGLAHCLWEIGKTCRNSLIIIVY